MKVSAECRERASKSGKEGGEVGRVLEAKADVAERAERSGDESGEVRVGWPVVRAAWCKNKKESTSLPNLVITYGGLQKSFIPEAKMCELKNL